MNSEEFKKLRLLTALTQEEFAALIGLSHSYVQSVESGRRTITPANELMIINRTQQVVQQVAKVKGVQNEFRKNVEELKSKGHTEALPIHNDSMMMTIMANATTSSVTLDLVCEVLSSVSGVNLRSVKARAKKLAQEKALKLGAVLDVMV
jgi:DNA-binding XRE family transcriptional regulator